MSLENDNITELNREFNALNKHQSYLPEVHHGKCQGLVWSGFYSINGQKSMSLDDDLLLFCIDKEMGE